jgi:DNA end-binding protein Ku
MWKADLEVDELRVPVKLYAAVNDTKVHFRLLHAKDLAPVKQQMVDPETDEPVPPEQIRRGIEVERGTLVMLTPEEQGALVPKPSRSITVERVVDAAKVDERWFDRPYYLGPDGDDETYFALAAALEAKRWLGVARWVMRNKRYVGALYASDGYLLLDTLRYSEEVVELGAIEPPAGRAPDTRELKLADQLVETLVDRFDASEYADEYRDRVLAMVEAKAKGKVVRLPKAPRRKRAEASLVKDLEASLAAGRKVRHAG